MNPQKPNVTDRVPGAHQGMGLLGRILAILGLAGLTFGYLGAGFAGRIDATVTGIFTAAALCLLAGLLLIYFNPRGQR